MLDESLMSSVVYRKEVDWGSERNVRPSVSCVLFGPPQSIKKLSAGVKLTFLGDFDCALVMTMVFDRTRRNR